MNRAFLWCALFCSVLGLAACLAFSILSGIIISVHASETTIELPGSYYEFEEKTKYTFSEEI